MPQIKSRLHNIFRLTEDRGQNKYLFPNCQQQVQFYEDHFDCVTYPNNQNCLVVTPCVIKNG